MLRKCDLHDLHFDDAAGNGCVICRRGGARTATPVPGPTRPSGRWIRAGALACVLAGGAYLVWTLVVPEIVASRTPPFTRLKTMTRSGRSGAYYLPGATGSLPLLVFLPGTGGNGPASVGLFRALADKRHFAILAPESDSTASWDVGDHPGEVTDDRRHVMDSLHEVLDAAAGRIDTTRVLIAGHSGGASSAPYVATNEEPFTHFAVLHGGVYVGGLGKRHVSGWFSTGEQDTTRPPALVQRAFEDARSAGVSAEMHLFPGDHGLGEAERVALVDWWLGAAP